MFTLVTLFSSPKYFSGDKIEKNEMSGACRMSGVRRGAYRVLVEKTDGKKISEESGVDGRIILRWMFRKWDRRH